MEKKVVVDADAVLTLSEVAKELHYGLRWKSHRTDARKGRIDFTDGEGRRFRLDLGGFAYAFIGKKESAESDPSKSICFREELSAKDFIWARDEHGRVVAIRE